MASRTEYYHNVSHPEYTTDRVAFLGEGKLLACAPVHELMENPHPAIQQYFKEYYAMTVEK